MKSLGKDGFQPGGKQKPYAGPMYSSGTKHQDSKNNVGSVHGPTTGKSIPDPMNYTGKK